MPMGRLEPVWRSWRSGLPGPHRLAPMSYLGAAGPAANGEGRLGRVARALWWSGPRAMALDVALGVASAAECAAEGAVFASRTVFAPWIFVVVGFVVGAILALRRRWPVLVVLVSLAVMPAQMGFLLGIVGLYTLAASDAPRRITLFLAGLTTLGSVTSSIFRVLNNPDQLGDLSVATAVVVVVASSTGITVAPVLLGLYMRARLKLVESLRERADGLEHELALLAEKASERAERARMEERTRIAREMHDVVAHRVSLMVVHAAALQSVVGKDPKRAARSAELVGDLGRQALNELRQMLGVLRAQRPGQALPAAPAEPEPVGPGPVVAVPEQRPEVGPRPSGGAAPRGGPLLSDVDQLVEVSRGVGMSVRLSVEGERRALAVEAERTAYRVVQEALTNVHKHAAGADALVRVAYRAEEVAVLVENGPPDGSPPAALPSGGLGLVGMRERVSALGGGFVAGATKSGGFRVSAVIPDRPR